MALGIDSNYLTGNGSPNCVMATSTAAGAVAAIGEQIGIIKDSELNDTTEQTKQVNEGGSKYTVDGAREVVWKATIMQRDPTGMEFFVKQSRGGYKFVVKELNEATMNSKRQYLVIPKLKVKPDLNTKLPGGDIVYEGTAEKMTAAATYNLATICPTGKFAADLPSPTNVTFASGDYWKLVEVSY